MCIYFFAEINVRPIAIQDFTEEYSDTCSLQNLLNKTYMFCFIETFFALTLFYFINDLCT